MPKYEIRKTDGFTLATCPVCGFWLWVGNASDLIEIKHITDPTTKTHSYHKIIFRDNVIVDDYGACYLPHLYPLLKRSQRIRILSKIERGEMLAEADSFLKIVDFRENPFHFLSREKRR